MSRELVRFQVRDTAGLFAARQLGREVARELALDRQDQIRVATALSEVGRELIVAGQTAEVAFGAAEGELVVRVEHPGPPPTRSLDAAAKLMDRVESTGAAVVIAKRRPVGGRLDIAGIRRRLASLAPVSELDELRRHNEDLVTALDELRKQQQELQLMNAELAETNQGVIALHAQLSDELDQTNRGVVALYAELDDTSQRLRDASEAKNRFWANVSHELRTPLNSIIGLTRLLTGPGGGELDAEQQHQVGLIQDAGGSLLTLVNELLDIAKAESGRLQADPAQVDVPAVLARLRTLLRPVGDQRPVSLVVDDAGAPATLLTDEVALTAILRNLLSNGLKYTDRGEVRLTVLLGQGFADFQVTDTGIGIPPGELRNVFEEFFQIPGVRRGGTGLGLSYARRLTGLLGGRLTLASELGRGTTVTLRLPYGTPRVGSVLIADDDPGDRRALRELLTGMADRIVEVADGAQALAAVGAGGIDLVLADLRMPDIDGYALLERLPAALPAIVVTAMDAMPPPPRASTLLRKDQLTRDRLEFAIRRIVGVAGE